MNFCGYRLCFQLIASFVVSLVALFSAVYIVIRGTDCDSETAFGLITTIVAAWVPSPISTFPPEVPQNETRPSPPDLETGELLGETTSYDDEYDFTDGSE